MGGRILYEASQPNLSGTSCRIHISVATGSRGLLVEDVVAKFLVAGSTAV